MATKRAPKQKTKRAPKTKKLRTAGFSNPNALRLDIPTPPTLRECLARGLFGSGICSPRGHREMSSRALEAAHRAVPGPLPAGRRLARPVVAAVRP